MVLIDDVSEANLIYSFVKLGQRTDEKEQNGRR